MGYPARFFTPHCATLAVDSLDQSMSRGGSLRHRTENLGSGRITAYPSVTSRILTTSLTGMRVWDERHDIYFVGVLCLLRLLLCC